MANPVFTGYKFRDSDYRSNNGKITDIIVSGDMAPYTINWTGPNGYSSEFNGTGPYNLTDLAPGEYQGVVTDGNGDTGTTTLTVNELERLVLSVDENKTTTDCEGVLNITDFKHNGFDFEYVLSDAENSVLGNYVNSEGNEAHQFQNLCTGAYKIVATEKERNEYVYDGSTTTTTVVASTNNCVFETYLTTKEVRSGSVSNNALTVANDEFESYGSTTESFLEFFTKDNAPASEHYSIKDQIVKSPKPLPNTDSIDCNTASLKISVAKKNNSNESACDYVSFSLDANGLVLFKHFDGTEDYNISQDCCSSLGFTSELDDVGRNACRWKEVITDPCYNYSITNSTNSSGYRLFINGETGETTDIVPSSECCANDNLSYVSNGNGFSCFEEVVNEPEPTCDDYVFTGDYALINDKEYAVFSLDGETTTELPSSECCVIHNLESESFGDKYRCLEPVDDCSTYNIVKVDSDGYAVFKKPDGFMTREVEDAECCGSTYEAIPQDNGMYKCQEPQPEVVLPRLELVNRAPSEDCSLMTMNVHGQPNSTVKYRILVSDPGNHGFFNTLSYKNGNEISPSQPTPAAGSYCEGSITLDSTGTAVIEMNTCARPPIKGATQTCSELEFAIYDYDYTTIAGNNKLMNKACFNY